MTAQVSSGRYNQEIKLFRHRHRAPKLERTTPNSAGLMFEGLAVMQKPQFKARWKREVSALG